MRTPDIIAIGEPMIEFNQTREDPRRYLQGFGGDTSNFIIAAARQGATTGYITRIGDDTFGQQLLALWRSENVDVAGVAIDPDAHTHVYFVAHNASGHSFSYLREGSAASRMKPRDMPLNLITGAKYLHISGISQGISASACDSVFYAIEAARAANVKICYDPNLRLKLWPLARARSTIVSTIADTDYFLPGLDDLCALSGLRDPEAIMDWCFEQGARQVVLKMGRNGVLVSDGQSQSYLAGHKVDAVDATGAGDCFDGAFVARIAAGDTLLEAANYANAAAALTTTGYGGVEPIPKPAAVKALLERAMSG